MLPLRSRTSWRLRALTVTCLPRDWTGAGVYHFANNRRRGHDLPEGHRGEPVEQAWATRHTRQSLGPADPRIAAGSSGPSGLQVRQDPGTPQALSRRWTSSTGSLRRRHGHHPDQLRQQRSRQHHPRQRITSRYQLQLGKSDPTRTTPWPPRASSARSGPANLQALQSLSLPPWAIRQAGMCGPDFLGPPASLTVNS
jgi:hypothetical protein